MISFAKMIDISCRMYFRSSIPPYMVVFVTDTCNAACSFCLNSEYRQSQRELDADKLARVASELKGVKYVTITGGEPFLKNDLIDILQIFYEKVGAYQINIPTNAILTDKIIDVAENILKRFPDKYLKIALTPHGNKEQHNNVLKVDNAYEMLEDTYRKLQVLKKKYSGFKIDITFLLRPENKNNACELLRNIKHTFKESDIGVLIQRPLDGSIPKWLSSSEYEAITDCAYNLNRPSLLNGIERCLYNLQRDVLKALKPVVRCQVGRKMMVLRSDGRLVPCEFSENKLNYEGVDLFGKGFNKAALKELYSKVEKECVCTHECANTVSSFFTVRNVLLLIKEYCRGIIAGIGKYS